MTSDALLDRLVSELGLSMTGDHLTRSAIERVLSMTSDRAAQARLLAMVEDLAGQGVPVVEDVAVTILPTRAPAPGGDAAADPLAAARRRLELDRRLGATRVRKSLLTSEEEVGLTLLARPGGDALPADGFAGLEGEARAAAHAMVLHNVGLAYAVAKTMMGQGLEYEDLVSHGVLGLVRAVEMFDPARGHKFSTYAMWWVKQHMTRAVANEGRLVRLPVHVHDRVRRVLQAGQELVDQGRAPTRVALAERCGMSLDEVEQLLRLSQGSMSLDTPLGHDGWTLADAVDKPEPAEEILVHGLGVEDVAPMLSRLSQRDADVLRRRYGLPPYEEPSTLDAIGQEYGLSRERIRQIEVRVMKTLREDPTRATPPTAGQGCRRRPGRQAGKDPAPPARVLLE